MHKQKMVTFGVVGIIGTNEPFIQAAPRIRLYIELFSPIPCKWPCKLILWGLKKAKSLLIGVKKKYINILKH